MDFEVAFLPRIAWSFWLSAGVGGTGLVKMGTARVRRVPGVILRVKGISPSGERVPWLDWREAVQ